MCAGLNQDLQDQLNQGQQLLGFAMQEAIVSEPAKAFGQDMLQDKPNEVMAFDGAVEGFAATALDISEGDVAILIGDYIAFTDDASVEVARQILQGGEAFSGAGAVDDPFSGNRMGHVESGFGQSFQKAGAKHPG